jgi:molybdopterin-guanine dinucleotide biosynthesis protein A
LSRRFGGSPKGLELVGGVRIIDRVVRALQAVTPDIILASNSPEASSWLDDVAVMADKYVAVGGLGGVHSGLSTGRDALVLAWDMPFVPGALLQALVTTAEKNSAAAMVPASRSPHGIEPFCAYYAQAALAPLEVFLRSGGGSAHAFLASLPNVRHLPLHEAARFGDAAWLYFSVNSADDLARARAFSSAPE